MSEIQTMSDGSKDDGNNYTIRGKEEYGGGGLQF